MKSLPQRIQNLEKTATSHTKTVLEHILEEIDGTTRGLPGDSCVSYAETICGERFKELLEWAAGIPWRGPG